MLKIIVTGDFCPDFSDSEYNKVINYKDIFGDFLEVIKGKDLHITNLECPLTNSTDKILKDGPHLKAKPEMIEAMKYAQVDVACMANNHILDFGTKGLLDTIDLCHKNNIKTVGAGKNISDASEILYISLKDKNIAIINITQYEFSVAYKDQGGANPLNLIQTFYAINEAKKFASIILVIVHGGNENYPLPSERLVDTFRFFAEIGASAVICHHSHCISGFEIYKNVPIIYGLGNFIFNSPFAQVPNNWYVGLIAELRIAPNNQITFELKPFYQCKKGTGFKLLEGPDKLKIMNEINQYSEIIKDARKLKLKWDGFVQESRHYYYSELCGLGRIRRKLFRLRFLQKWIFPMSRKTVLYDMIRCEAHNDVISDLLINDINKR